jgi:CBS-domain-containing membrane protein
VTVAAILGQKSHSVITAQAEETLKAVCNLLSTHRIGAVVVSDGKGGIAGILSERDIVKAGGARRCRGARSPDRRLHDPYGEDVQPGRHHRRRDGVDDGGALPPPAGRRGGPG